MRSLIIALALAGSLFGIVTASSDTAQARTYWETQQDQGG